ncbi:transcription factor HES-4 [Alosa alosa]|uniref:transcription factor HES-4 n=1 Tax=Alosa sapidissima TaxID=34773 RepID=UPI001C08610B|nr:transcription factor HES-4 [Alosa sapidissima]XP_048092680.1 transcription factor HES-4 [Alosa alosa]
MSSPVSLKAQQKQRAHRKSSKPLMERRRRARINACLAQLHVLLARARITQTCRRSRLEKADILEMTVRHLKSITSQNTDATLWSRFYSGYTDCTREVSRFLSISGAHQWRSAFLQPG